jgi:hypothetical protein
MSTLRTPRKYRGKTPGIPFSVIEKGSTRYKVKLRLDAAVANFARNDAIEEALDHYITHYFPEFYIALYDQSAFAAANEDPNDPATSTEMWTTYTTLREQLKKKTEIITQYPTSPPSAKEVMVFSLRYDIFKARNELTKRKFVTDTPDRQQMPSFEASLEYFNNEQGFGATEGQTEFAVKKMSSTSQALQGAFAKFGKQQKRSNGPQVPMPMDFGFLGNSVNRVMSTLVDDLVARTKGDGKAYKFREGDTLTLYFGRSDIGETSKKLIVVPKYGVTDIKYLASDKSIAAEHLKIGHFSLVKYSSFLKDPVVVAALKNHDSVLKMDKDAGHGSAPFSIEDFFGNTFGIDLSNGLPMDWNTSNDPLAEQDDENNAWINTATVELGIIDIADTAALQVSIGAYTTEQLVALNEEVTNNPELYQSVFEGQEKKKEETAPDFLDQIQKILLEGPMAAVDDNSPIGSFFRHFGIKTLVKEALLCLTFGMNFEIARIVALVDEIKGIAENGNIVVEFGGSVQGITKPQIPIPSFGDLSMSFPMFTISGDIWKMILEIVIENLEKALIQVIAQLTELLRELCDFNNPRSRDYGDTNMGDLIPRSSPKSKPGTSPPDMGAEYGPYDPFRGTNAEESSGMTSDEIYEYLEQVSIVLSSMDVCVLLTQPASTKEELVQKILDFNLAYDKVPAVSENLNTFTAIIGFFAELAKIVDVTDLCNEIANEVATLNQDNICLTEDDIQSINMDDMDNIETLLDILQNGLRPEVFKPDLECPDSPNYVEDPTFRKSIYETLNALVETVELQFSYSSESIKNVLLDSRLAKASGAAYNAVAESGNELPEEWAKKPNKAMINILKTILEALEDVGPMADQIQACINDNQDMLELEATIDIEVIPQILAAVIEGMEIAFAAGGKLGGLIDTLGDVANAVEDGAGAAPVISKKVFNKRFLREFKDYILMNDRGEVTSYDRFSTMNPIASMNSTPKVLEVPSSAGDAWNFMAEEVHPPNGTVHEQLKWYFRPIIMNPRQSARSDYTITDATGSVLLRGDAAGYAEARAARKFPTSEPGYIALDYPDYQSTAEGVTSFELDALFQGVQGTTAAFRQEVLSEQQGLTMDPFVQTVYRVLCTDTYPPGNPGELNYQSHKRRYAKRRVFPVANALLTDYVFDYFIKNGIFDAATLQSLNFFHNNENCAPGDASDLLDVDGIINKMLRMFENLACGSDLPARKKVRLALKYGMYLLFVQIHIAEFVIKNIFVFSATEIDVLFGKQFIALYMRAQIENSLSNYMADVDAEVRKMFMDDLIELFQQLNQIQGGITDYAGNVVFNSGEKLPANTTTYNKIINYMIGERITDSKSAVNNAIKQSHPNANPKSLDEIFLRSMPVYEMLNDDWLAHSNIRMEPMLGPWLNTPRLFITKTYVTRASTQAAAPNNFGDPNTLDPSSKTHIHPIAQYSQNQVHPNDNEDSPPQGSPGYINEHREHGNTLYPGDHEHPNSPDLGKSVPYGPTDSSSAPDEALPTLPDSTDYVLRYKFWLNFRDRNLPDPIGAYQTRVYPLLPSDDRSLPYEFQDQFLDRDITIEPDDPRLSLASIGDTQQLPDYETSLTQEDVDFLTSSPEYKEYFTNVFNREVISMIPIIQNFYLTTKYFDEIPGTMKTTKDACLNIVKNTIESDDRYDKTPDMSRKVANTFKMDDAFESFAREFILIMLVKTPIDILKGILELIDPHVAISKLIKNITGQVFNILSRVFDEILESAEPLQELGLDTGEKLLTVVLCLVEVIMKNPGATNDTEATAMLVKQEMEAFFPRISADGIDFLGSIMGMFMIPPSPLGILYLLLSLINVEIPSFGADKGDNSVVNSEDSSKPTEC